jgi:hypothetical protein
MLLAVKYSKGNETALVQLIIELKLFSKFFP